MIIWTCKYYCDWSAYVTELLLFMCRHCLLTLVQYRMPQSPNRYSDEVKPFFKHKDWAATIDFIQDKYDIKQQPMPLKAVTSMLVIIGNLLAKNINREQAETNLKALSLSSHGQKFVKALKL